MGFLDLVMLTTYVFLVLVLGIFIRGRNIDNPLYRKYFMKGLAVKVIGAIGFTMVYTFYYTYGGDSRSYFKDADTMVGYLFSEPSVYFGFFLDASYVSREYIYELRNFGFSPGSTEWFTARIVSLVTIFGLRNYFATSILMSFFTFLGVWKFFLMICGRYPKVHKGLALSILFVPSVFFWGSGLLKDAVVLGALGYLMYYVDVFARRGVIYKVGSALIILFCSYVIYNIKSYVIISLLPSILIWVVLEFKDKVESPVIRALLVPVLITGSLLGAIAAFQFLSQFSDKYSVDNVIETAQGMQKWHYAKGEESADEIGRGSGYTLGDYDATYTGLLSQFFPAVNVTLFRPYLWEVKNVAMLAAAIESTIILGFSLFVFLGLGFFRVIKLLKEDSFLLMAVFFAIFFAFAVGFSSYNFGALVRYKIPCIPFYLASLFVLRQKVADLKEAKRVRYSNQRDIAHALR